MPFADSVAAFRAGLLAEAPAPVPAPVADGPEAARRFAVHRNNVAHGLVAALRRRFPVVERLVGEAYARALFGAFARAHPPRSPLMMRYGAAFPGFLETFPPVAALPYLPDVARLERARGEAYHAADAAPAPAEALAAAAMADPDRVALRLHPSVTILRSRHPIHAIWAANQPGATPKRIDGGRPETVLVARSGAAVLTAPLAPGEAAFDAALAAGLRLGPALAAGLRAEPDFDAGPALARLIAAGLVTGAALLPIPRPEEETTR